MNGLVNYIISSEIFSPHLRHYHLHHKEEGKELDAGEERENIKQNISAKRKNQHAKGKNVLEDEDKNNLNFLNNSYYLETIGLYIHIIY
jgi:hypothetical protein